jgi:hypothetical protein
MTLYDKLIKYKDEEYKHFQEKLVPNISPDLIIGIRTPNLRTLAKEIYYSDQKDEFLNNLPHKYYEENLIHFFMISLIKDFDECVNKVEEFLPYVDCWPVSDQSSPIIFKKNHLKLLPYIKKWINSKHTYTARFGIRMLMNEFLDNDFKDEYLKIVAEKKGEDYYLKMMIAWYFATALAKQYDATIYYFTNYKLDKWIHNKAIQKALESYRVAQEHKNYLRTLKIK